MIQNPQCWFLVVRVERLNIASGTKKNKMSRRLLPRTRWTLGRKRKCANPWRAIHWRYMIGMEGGKKTCFST